MTYEKGKANCYLEGKSLNKAARDIINKVQKSYSFLRRWEKIEFETAKELHKFCDKLDKMDFKKLDDDELLKLYHKGVDVYLKHDSGVAVIRNTNRLLQEKLLRIYKNPSIVALLLSTEEESFILKEYKQLLKIAEKVRKKHLKRNEVEKLLEKHTKKNFYLSCGFYNEKPLTKNDFRKKLKEILRRGEDLKNFEEKLKIEIKKRRELIAKLKPSEKLKRLIDFGSTCTYFKDFIRGNLNRFHWSIRKIFKEIAKRTGNKWEKIACLTPEEINEILKEKKKIKKRNFAVLFSDKKGIHLILGKRAKEVIKRLKKKLISKISKEIVGIGANPGKARGKVLLVKKNIDFKNKSNFILVSPMTTPDLVPAIKKAKAIVTDEGGLTCHAAIISRELGLPCIIGTKIATKILKDNDLVEVDANKGRVKIIGR